MVRALERSPRGERKVWLRGLNLDIRAIGGQMLDIYDIRVRGGE